MAMEQITNRWRRTNATAIYEPVNPPTADVLRKIGTMEPSDKGFTVEPSTLYLTNSERAEIRAFARRIKHIEANSEERKLARVFRILDLPVDVRLMIYEHTFQEKPNDEHVLAVTATPKVARVCKTFRAEALPLFFANTEFHLPIGSNLLHRALYRKHALGGRFNALRTSGQQKRAGVLNFKKPVKKAIRDAGNDAVFRNVVLQMFEVAESSFPRAGGGSRFSCFIEIKLSFCKGQLRVDATEKYAHPSNNIVPRKYRWAGKYPIEREDVDVVVAEVRRVAARIASTAGFKGLKLCDLESLARAFRFTQPR